MQTIYLDISNKGVVPTVYAKQNDVGRKFAVILTDSGLPYIPANGSAFSVWYKGAIGEGNYTDIGNKSAFSLNVNKVEVEMIAQMLSAHGDGILCLTLNSPDGNQISSWNIPYICEMVPGSESEKAEEYYTAFSESVEKLKQVTENLTPEAIGAAPAGYGYGGILPQAGSAADTDGTILVSRLNNRLAEMKNGEAKQIRWITYPFLDGKWRMGTLFRASDAQAVLTGIAYDGAEVRKTYNNGEWGEFEWINPPMTVGKEYRTIKRYNVGGLTKAVYVKRLQNVNLRANDYSDVEIGSTITALVDLKIVIKSGTTSRILPDIDNKVEADVVDNSKVRIFAMNADMSSYYAEITIEYTKD